MTAHLGTDHAATSLERALALRVLSLGLAPPSRGTLDEVDLLAASLVERCVLEDDLELLRASLLEESVDEVAAAHSRLFGGNVAVPPYEGSYESDPFRQARQLADVAGFYAAFGAGAAGPAAERADHAGAELEFLAFLALRRVDALAHGREDEAALCREIEASFLATHAGRWLPLFFRSVAAAADDQFHVALALLGERVVLDAVAWHGVTVEPAPTGRGRRTAVEGDDMACAAGDEPVVAL
jgi:TorA maturation chaperone TorD